MNKIHPEQQHSLVWVDLGDLREARKSCGRDKQCLVLLGPLGTVDVMVVAERRAQEGC